MNRQKVISSNIVSIGYDLETQTLEIEFLNGAIFQYFDIPKILYEEIMDAKSKGEIVATKLRGFYRYSRV